jgi:Ca-activated chloride channel homolog
MIGTQSMENTARRFVVLALCTAVFMLFCAASWKDVFRSLPEEAAQAYGQEDFEQALKLYQEAQTHNPDSDTLAYNLGNTLYKLGRFQDAAGQFGRILESDSTELWPRTIDRNLKSDSTELSSRTIYNMGNSLFEMGKAEGDQQKLNQALEAFKQLIINDPSDEDSKYNYEQTHRLIQQQEQQQNQQQQNDDNKEKNDQQQDDQQQQQNQDQQQEKQQQPDPDQQKEQENKSDQQQQQQEQEQQQQQQQPQPQPGEMSEEEAEKILQALMQMEKDAQEKEQKQKVPATGSKGRDW